MPRLHKVEEAESRHQKRCFVFSASEKWALMRIGHQIYHDLIKRGETVESLADRAKIARSTLREILAGRSNLRFLTLCGISKSLGYENVMDFCHAAFNHRRPPKSPYHRSRNSDRPNGNSKT